MSIDSIMSSSVPPNNTVQIPSSSADLIRQIMMPANNDRHNIQRPSARLIPNGLNAFKCKKAMFVAFIFAILLCPASAYFEDFEPDYRWHSVRFKFVITYLVTACCAFGVGWKIAQRRQPPLLNGGNGNGNNNNGNNNGGNNNGGNNNGGNNDLHHLQEIRQRKIEQLAEARTHIDDEHQAGFDQDLVPHNDPPGDDHQQQHKLFSEAKETLTGPYKKMFDTCGEKCEPSEESVKFWSEFIELLDKLSAQFVISLEHGIQEQINKLGVLLAKIKGPQLQKSQMAGEVDLVLEPLMDLLEDSLQRYNLQELWKITSVSMEKFVVLPPLGSSEKALLKQLPNAKIGGVTVTKLMSTHEDAFQQLALFVSEFEVRAVQLPSYQQLFHRSALDAEPMLKANCSHISGHPVLITLTSKGNLFVLSLPSLRILLHVPLIGECVDMDDLMFNRCDFSEHGLGIYGQ
ncbi:Phorbol ester/diacylglycerol-binding protein unc-13 [Globodera pallida]|nr:Phorbol ester/diacylglycerol-binding protein unc-13 [Globodera pallida]